MKVTGVILFFVALQVKASFFDDFRGAMSSVENAFGKLLNDVVTDVKSTVHCTILAMEHVLAINGVLVEPLPNNDCNNTENDNGNHLSEDNIATQIHSSISRVNKTLSHVLDNSDHKRIQDVKRNLKNESNHLTKVSYLLRQELEKISHRTGKEFQSKDLNSDKTSVDSLWNNMKILHDIERDDKNISEVTEIGQVLNEALNLFNVNGEQKSDEDKIQAIMLEVEHETNNNNVNAIDTITNEISKWKNGQPAQKINKEEKPKSFKDNEKNGKDVDNHITNTSSSVNNKLIHKSSDYETKGGSGNSEMYSPFSDTNSKDNKKAVDEAMDIFNEAVKTEALMDELFGQKDRGVDAFNNSNLFNFF